MNICFIAPYYSEQSNGIRVLYKAALLFAKVNENCILKIYDAKNNQILSSPDLEKIPKKFHSMISGNLEFSKDYVYFLPETPSQLPSNLSNSHKIVRYLLANPFFFNQKAINFKNNFLLSYSNFISKKLPQLYLEDLPKLPLKKVNFIKQKKTLIYFGKFRLKKNLIKNIDVLSYIINKYDVEIIHRKYPKTHEQYLQKLKTANLLICYDPMSSVSHEASLIGIPVIMVDSLIMNDSFNYNLKNIFFLEELSFDKNKINNIKGYHYKNNAKATTSILKVKKLIKLIEAYFSSLKVKSKYDKIFFKEMFRLKKSYEKNFDQGIVSFDSYKKIFLIILFYLYPDLYKKIKKKYLNNKSFFLLSLIIYLVFHLNFKFINFFFYFIKLCLFYKFFQIKFIKEFNKLLA